MKPAWLIILALAMGCISSSQPTEQIGITSIKFQWETYQNTDLGFEIKHPHEWPVDFSGNMLTVGEAACSLTITFVETETALVPRPEKTNRKEGAQRQECDKMLENILSSFKFA